MKQILHDYEPLLSPKVVEGVVDEKPPKSLPSSSGSSE